jgi:hypothetical protein
VIKVIRDFDIDNELLVLKLQGFKLHTKNSVLHGAVYTWFQPIGEEDHEMYLETYSDFMGYDYNAMRSISMLKGLLAKREEEKE